MRLTFRVFGLALIFAVTAFTSAHGYVYNYCRIDCNDGTVYFIQNTTYDSCCWSLHDTCYGRGGGTADLVTGNGDQACPPY